MIFKIKCVLNSERAFATEYYSQINYGRKSLFHMTSTISGSILKYWANSAYFSHVGKDRARNGDTKYGKILFKNQLRKNKGYRHFR